jgi:hypothetical protein
LNELPRLRGTTQAPEQPSRILRKLSTESLLQREGGRMILEAISELREQIYEKTGKYPVQLRCSYDAYQKLVDELKPYSRFTCSRAMRVMDMDVLIDYNVPKEEMWMLTESQRSIFED